MCSSDFKKWRIGTINTSLTSLALGRGWNVSAINATTGVTKMSSCGGVKNRSLGLLLSRLPSYSEKL